MLSKLGIYSKSDKVTFLSTKEEKEKFNKITTDYDIEISNVHLDMKISNHKLVNYTGKALIMYKIKLKSDKIYIINENQKYLQMILSNFR